MAEAQGSGIVRRIYANMSKLVGGKAAAGLIGLAYMAMAARALGPRDYGVLILVHGFAMTVGGIIEFPGWHAIVRYGAQARATGDLPRLARLVRFAGLIELTGGACAIIVFAILAPWLGPRLGWSPAATAFSLPYSLAVLASIRATPAGYLQLVGRFDLLGWHNVIPPIVRLIGATIAIAIAAGLRGFLLAWLVASLAEWAAMWAMGWWVARRDLAGQRSRGSTSRICQENPGLWRFMLGANADVTLSELSDRLVPQVIGWTMGPAAAGLFAIAQRATVMLAQPAQILGRAAYAELARLVAAGRPLRRAVAQCIGIALLASAPVVVLLVFFGRDVAMVLGGIAFGGAASLIGWLAIARAILLCAPPISAALTALGHPWLSVAANSGAALALLPLLPILAHAHGVIGAGWYALAQATLATALLVGFGWRVTGEAVRSVRFPCPG